MTDTIDQLAQAFASGRVTSEGLIEQALAAIDRQDGEGAATFTTVYRQSAPALARAADTARCHGIVPSPLAGLPVSIKDLFDVRGETTQAGSRVLAGTAAAIANAPVIARLRRAGAVLVGRTNMTEFAYSGLGINPHYGTPLNPWDRETGRIPGGSSSGAAVSVTDGMAVVGIGTDTGGSVRIPAASCGLTGFKPTARRVERRGAFPLSGTLDSIGPLARSVACCAVVDQIISGSAIRPVTAVPPARMRFAVPTTIVLEDLDVTVAAAFSRALSDLSTAGAQIVEVPFPAFADIQAANTAGGFAAAEAYATLRGLLLQDEHQFDPRVASRINRGSAISAADYIDLVAARDRICRAASAVSREFDALLMPTVPTVAPEIRPLVEDDNAYHTSNMLNLRNCSFGNFLDRCAVSLPIHRLGEAPVGLMVMGETMSDARLLEIAAGIEKALA